MWLSDMKLVRCISQMHRTILSADFLVGRSSGSRLGFLRKAASPLILGAFFGLVLMVPFKRVHAAVRLETRLAPAGMGQALVMPQAASTPQPTPAPASGRPVRVTTGLVLLFAAGLLIALVMAGIGLALGLWMKRHDKT